MKFAWFPCLAIPISVFAQHQAVDVPRDTSFTVYSTAVKVLEQYPFARVVIPELPKGVAVKENIIFASYGKRELHLDLFRPGESAGGPFPAVILIHGGGWRSGDRAMEVPLAQYLAARGYVAAVVEYRLSPEALYPAAVYDVKAAIRWMRAHCEEYDVDSTRIAVLGVSAGGQLAALVGTTNGDPRFEGSGGNAGYSSNVQAIVDVDGILDFTDPAESGKDTIAGRRSAGAAWFGATYREKPELWIEASPLVHVSESSPPIVFINSSSERFHAGRDEMIEKLKALNIYHEVHTIPKTPHPFWLFHPWFEPTCNYITAFLEKILKGSPRNSTIK